MTPKSDHVVGGQFPFMLLTLCALVKGWFLARHVAHGQIFWQHSPPYFSTLSASQRCTMPEFNLQPHSLSHQCLLAEAFRHEIPVMSFSTGYDRLLSACLGFYLSRLLPRIKVKNYLSASLTTSFLTFTQRKLQYVYMPLTDALPAKDTSKRFHRSFGDLRPLIRPCCCPAWRCTLK